jgi:hypothetical protein
MNRSVSRNPPTDPFLDKQEKYNNCLSVEGVSIKWEYYEKYKSGLVRKYKCGGN